MHTKLILLSVLVATVCGKSVTSLKPMSHEMIDFINNEAQTTWKVYVQTICDFLCIHCSMDHYPRSRAVERLIILIALIARLIILIVR